MGKIYSDKRIPSACKLLFLLSLYHKCCPATARTSAKTLTAPACFSVLADSFSVAPLVLMSSTRQTFHPANLCSRQTANALATFFVFTRNQLATRLKLKKYNFLLFVKLFYRNNDNHRTVFIGHRYLLVLS